jgi:ADP-heptose:LPS heptosyltransferase
MTSILIVLPNNLGDVIMALPVIESIKHSSEDISITFFVEQGYEGGALNNPNIDRLFLFPRKQIKQLLTTSDWQEGMSILKKNVDLLRSYNFDSVINLCQHTYTATLLSQLDIPNIFGRYFLPQGCHAITDLWSRYLYSIPYSRMSSMLHAVDVYKYIAGVAGTQERGTIHLSKDEADSARQFLTSNKMPSGARFVLIHPGAAYQSKMWPVEYVITLAKKLINDGYWIVITGSDKEVDIADAVKLQTGSQCIIASGKLDFRGSISLASQAQFCITGDTAMMHAAAALNVKVCALFGPTSPVETGPYGAGHIIFSGRCPTRPCFCFDCKTKLCMKSITPETVYSFITTGKHDNASCDIYTTFMHDDTTYGLVPVCEKGPAYYYKPYAEMTRMLFDTSFKLTCSIDELCTVKVELEKVIDILHSIDLELSSFMTTSDMTHIHQYETLRTELENLQGISKFLSAFLNTGLNSIPLTTAILSVQKSLQVCRSLRQTIQDSVNAM